MEKLDTFLLNLANTVLNPLILLLFGIALLYFLWGVMMYIQNSQSESERKKGRDHIMWSIIGIVIMMGVYTILTIALNSVL